MTIGLDYTSRISPAALKAAGASVICRYIAPQAWKVISKSEYNELISNGFTVYLNWESAATDWSGGAAAGASHGKQAAAMAHALGYPAGSIIIGSCDYDISVTAANTVGHAYGAAFKAALEAGGYKAGVYGPTNILDVCEILGYSFFWQTMSTGFSGGKNRNQHSATNLWQKGYKTVAGQQCDYSTIIRLPGASAPPKPKPQPRSNGMNLNEKAMLDAVFNLTDTVTLYETLNVLATWNIDTWIHDLNTQGHAVTWAQMIVANPDIVNNASTATNTFLAAATYVDPSKPKTVPNPLALAMKAGSGSGATVSVDLDSLATKVAAQLHELSFKAQ